MVHVYIAGYITRKNKDNSKFDTSFYFEKYGDYTKELNCGGLKIPTDHTCQWLFFCFILFHTLKENVCHRSSSNIFMLISDFHFFQHGKKACSNVCKYCFQ